MSEIMILVGACLAGAGLGIILTFIAAKLGERAGKKEWERRRTGKWE